MTSKISVPTLMIALGAGLASGGLFATLIGASLMALPLFLAAPLPIMLVTLGWGTLAGGLAGFIAVAGIQIELGTHAAGAMAVAIIGPALAMAHLARRSHPVDPQDPQGPRRWYPLGALLSATVVMVSVVTVLGAVAIGFDPDTTTAQVVGALRATQAEGAATGAPAPEAMQLEPFVRATVRLMPAFFPATWLLVLVIDLWLAAKVVVLSKRALRPMDDLAAVDLPIAAGLVFVVAVMIAVFVPGTPGLIGEIVTGALLAAHFLVGLGVLHTATRGSDMRWIILAFVYGIVLLFTIPAALIALVGLFEPFLGLRRRQPSA